MSSNGALPEYGAKLKILFYIAIGLILSNFVIPVLFYETWEKYLTSTYQAFSMFTIGSDQFEDQVLIHPVAQIFIQFEGLVFIGIITALIILLVEKKVLVSHIQKQSEPYFKKLLDKKRDDEASSN